MKYYCQRSKFAAKESTWARRMVLLREEGDPRRVLVGMPWRLRGDAQRVNDSRTWNFTVRFHGQLILSGSGTRPEVLARMDACIRTLAKLYDIELY